MLELGDGLILIIYFENSSRERFPRTKIPPSVCIEVFYKSRGLESPKIRGQVQGRFFGKWNSDSRQLGRAREVAALASASGDVLHF